MTFNRIFHMHFFYICNMRNELLSIGLVSDCCAAKLISFIMIQDKNSFIKLFICCNVAKMT